MIKKEKFSPLPQETLKSIAKGTFSIDDAVNTLLEGKSSEMFSELFSLDDIHEKGLSDELLEWVLVDLHILLPQSANTVAP